MAVGISLCFISVIGIIHFLLIQSGFSKNYGYCVVLFHGIIKMCEEYDEKLLGKCN